MPLNQQFPNPVVASVSYTAPAGANATNSVSRSAGVYVSEGVGTLTMTSADATYHLDATYAYTPDSASIKYDQIFDITLTKAQSIKLLNAFDVSNAEISDYSATTRSAVFNDADADALSVLRDVISGALAGADNAEAYLTGDLNAWIQDHAKVAVAGADFSSATATSSKIEGINPEELRMFIDASSGAVVVDVSASAVSAATACLKAKASALFKQLPADNLHAYENTTENNAITTDSLPLLSGDKIVFALLVATKNVGMTPTNGTFDDGAAAETRGEDFSTAASFGGHQLAFRLTVKASDSAADGDAFTVTNRRFA